MESASFIKLDATPDRPLFSLVSLSLRSPSVYLSFSLSLSRIARDISVIFASRLLLPTRPVDENRSAEKDERQARERERRERERGSYLETSSFRFRATRRRSSLSRRAWNSYGARRRGSIAMRRGAMPGNGNFTCAKTLVRIYVLSEFVVDASFPADDAFDEVTRDAITTDAPRTSVVLYRKCNSYWR